MPNAIQDIYTKDDASFEYTFEQNITIPLKSSTGIVRCNVYRPKSGSDARSPVIMTYGPYGKDLPYEDFHPASFSEVPEEQKSIHSAWELPSPDYWTKHGYAVIRVDERGLGQSPGVLDTMSRGTSEAFFDAVEWAAEQPWSNGKVGLLGISYYAGSQWRVAALRPKGLAAMIPWEGMSDYYRDRCRHGGILSDAFINFWWERQVLSNQYGRPGRAARNWGPDTIEGDLNDDELLANRNEQPADNANNTFRDDIYYASKEYDMGNIEVPLLSVANWGGIMLHLRGNIEGFHNAGSKIKYLRCITGRHDLPFYYPEEVEVQRSFMDAFLKGEDQTGWSRPGELPQVDMVLRKGDVGHNNREGEKTYSRRTESEWPIARTQYTKFYLGPDRSLSTTAPSLQHREKLSWKAPSTLDEPQLLQFSTAPLEEEYEVTGHITARLSVSMSPSIGGTQPSDIDLFVTMRHIGAGGKEVHYTGTAGDPVPLCKGWLRVSNRKVNTEHVRHRDHLPYRDYFRCSVLPVLPGEIYPVDIEIWPTNVVLEPGAKLVFEVASGDTQGSGVFQHKSPVDRPIERFVGMNSIHFGPSHENFVTLPIIPGK